MSEWIKFEDQKPPAGQYLLACDYLGCAFPAIYDGHGIFLMLYLEETPGRLEKKEYWMFFPNPPGVCAIKEINK